MTCIPDSLVTHPQRAIPRQMAWRGCLHWCLQPGTTVPLFAIQLLKILLNFCPSADLQDWIQRVDHISSLNFLFLYIRNSPAVTTLVWHSAERKKGPMHCAIFCYFWFLRSFWSLQILCGYCVSWKFSCQSKLSCIHSKLSRLIAAQLNT